jgi:hypothetical protein
MEEFHKRIHDIQVFNEIPDDFTKWPSVKVEAFKNEDIEKLKQVILWLKKQLVS